MLSRRMQEISVREADHLAVQADLIVEKDHLTEDAWIVAARFATASRRFTLAGSIHPLASSSRAERIRCPRITSVNRSQLRFVLRGLGHSHGTLGPRGVDEPGGGRNCQYQNAEKKNAADSDQGYAQRTPALRGCSAQLPPPLQMSAISPLRDEMASRSDRTWAASW